MSAIRTYNVEAGLPNLDEARRLVIEEIRQARHESIRVLKVIHGYGSSGKGGALCIGLRKSFWLRKNEGAIKDFIAGEDFSIFNETVLTLLEVVPEMRGDPDLNSRNHGPLAEVSLNVERFRESRPSGSKGIMIMFMWSCSILRSGGCGKSRPKTWSAIPGSPVFTSA